MTITTEELAYLRSRYIRQRSTSDVNQLFEHIDAQAAQIAELTESLNNTHTALERFLERCEVAEKERDAATLEYDYLNDQIKFHSEEVKRLYKELKGTEDDIETLVAINGELANELEGLREQEPIYQYMIVSLSDETWLQERWIDCTKEKFDEVNSELERTRIVYSQQQPILANGLHPDTADLVNRFAIVLAEKLYGAQVKYGYDADWKREGWHGQCLEHFHQHIAKGDPRDVAAYCAFMWHHGWSTAADPVACPPSVGITAEHQQVIGLLLSVCGAAFELADDACQQEVDGELCHVVPDDAFSRLSDALDEIENTLPDAYDDIPNTVLQWAAVPRHALRSLLRQVPTATVVLQGGSLRADGKFWYPEEQVAELIRAGGGTVVGETFT